MDQQQIIACIEATKIIPLFNHEDEKIALEILETSYNAGIRVIEFTNRSDNAFAVFSTLIKVKSKFPNLAIGIGTIFECEATKKFLEAGADFIVSPILKPAMAEICHQYKKLWIPGCGTVTEIATAIEHGAQIIKIFPGSVLGPQFVSAVHSVMPHTNLMISGGVEANEQNLSTWFKAGAFCVGMGSQLFDKEVISTNNWEVLKTKITDVVSLLKNI